MHEPNAPYSPLLAEQLLVLRDRRADVTEMLELGAEHDEALLDLTANDLVGVRLVIRAALSGRPPEERQA